jgi:dsRNA-specific ribonuclease
MCIKYSKKEGARSPNVLGKAVNAILGAVFLDCRENLTVVLGVMQRLGLVHTLIHVAVS